MKKQIVRLILRNLNLSIFISVLCALSFYEYFMAPFVIFLGYKVYCYFMKNYGLSALKIRFGQMFNFWNLTIKQIADLIIWTMRAYVIYAIHYAVIVVFFGLIN